MSGLIIGLQCIERLLARNFGSLLLNYAESIIVWWYSSAPSLEDGGGARTMTAVLIKLSANPETKRRLMNFKNQWTTSEEFPTSPLIRRSERKRLPPDHLDGHVYVHSTCIDDDDDPQRYFEYLLSPDYYNWLPAEECATWFGQWNKINIVNSIHNDLIRNDLYSAPHVKPIVILLRFRFISLYSRSLLRNHATDDGKTLLLAFSIYELVSKEIFVTFLRSSSMEFYFSDV